MSLSSKKWEMKYFLLKVSIFNNLETLEINVLSYVMDWDWLLMVKCGKYLLVSGCFKWHDIWFSDCYLSIV